MEIKNCTHFQQEDAPNHNFNLISDFWKHIFCIIACIFRATNIPFRALHLFRQKILLFANFPPSNVDIFYRSLIDLSILALNRGFFAGLRAARPEFNKRRLIVRWRGGERPIDAWICAEDALGDFFEARRSTCNYWTTRSFRAKKRSTIFGKMNISTYGWLNQLQTICYLSCG